MLGFPTFPDEAVSNCEDIALAASKASSALPDASKILTRPK
jgi:hypothetical protein